MRYIAALAVLLAPACFSQDGTKTETSPTITPTSTWSGIYSFDLKNRYLGSITGGVFADQTVAWQDLDITRTFRSGTSMTITIWNSTGLTRSTWFKNFAYETDIDVNVSHKFGKYTVGAGADGLFLLYPGAGTHVLVADLKVSRMFVNGKNIFEPFVELQQYGLTNKMTTMHGGMYPLVGATYARKVTKRITVPARFHEGLDANGAFGLASGKALFYTESGLQFSIGSLSINLPKIGYGGSRGTSVPSKESNVGRRTLNRILGFVVAGISREMTGHFYFYKKWISPKIPSLATAAFSPPNSSAVFFSSVLCRTSISSPASVRSLLRYVIRYA